MLKGLDAVFTPERVALVGASERAGTVGRLLWQNLTAFPGEVVPISRAPTVFAHTAYPDLGSAPGHIDLAIVAVPATGVLPVIRDAAAGRVSAAVILSAGFAETGSAGAAQQRAMVDVARAAGMRLVGPNCFGVQNSAISLNASIAPGLPPTPRPGRPGISLVTQSGAYGMAVHSLGRDESIPFAKVYAAGNKADIADHEVLSYLADDPATGVICLLLESISQPREFFEHARRATARKPVIVTLTGRSAAGRRAALSHTGSLATTDRLLDAMLRQAGVVRTRTGLQMLDAARALVDQPHPAGPRVGIITNSGGTGVELADLLVDEGLTLPEWSAGLRERLQELLPEYASAGNPVDMTPVWPRFAELYPQLIGLLARSGEVDVVIPILLQRSATETVAQAVRDAVQVLRDDEVQVPVHVCWVASRDAQPAADLLQRAGVPCLAWPDRTAPAVAAAVRASRTTAPPARRPRSTEGQRLSPKSWSAVLGQRDLLAGSGIRVAITEICATAAEAAAAANRLGYPAVLKVQHPELSHKSDVGGVDIGLLDDAAVRRAADRLLAIAPGAAVLVQRHHHGLELVVGGLRDPDLGPMVMVGIGGVTVELLGDTRFAVAPLTAEEATEMWLSLRCAPLLTGYRGSDAVDMTSLASLAVSVGDILLTNPAITEIDLNPVLAGKDGYLAVDWRIGVRILPPGGEEP